MSTWIAAGPLPVATWEIKGNLVRLADGRVLLAGGADAVFQPTTAASVFDPRTGTWTATGPMGRPRVGHSLTPLPDGRLLAAGGLTGPPASLPPTTGTAEIYDPVAGTWTPTAPMAAIRNGHNAVPLPDGRVLVAGGLSRRDAVSVRTQDNAEIYDPATATWAVTGSMTDRRAGGEAVVLDDGRVLMIGGVVYTGFGTVVATAFCELYDPAAGTWSPTGSMAVPRSNAAAAKLADGTVLVVGSWHSEAVDGVYDMHSAATAERYDPATGRWTPTAPMPFGRCFHDTSLLPSGEVLVIGGTDDAMLAAGYRNVMRYQPLSDTWAQAAGLATGRYGHAAVALADGRVLVAGGVSVSGAGGRFEGDNHVVADTEVFTP
jgi:N-acetylneuraminic acid mutarotase